MSESKREAELLIKDKPIDKERILEDDDRDHLEWKHYLLLFDIIIITYFSQMMIAVPMTFFSRIVVDRNETLTTASIILQSSPAAAACVGVPIGRYLHILQVKRTIVIGVLLEAYSSIGFGFLGLVKSNTAFAIIGTMLRVSSGFGNCAVYTAVLALSVSSFPKQRNFILGLIEGCIGLSYLTGVMFGALLYNVYQDMQLPFVITGGCYLLSVLRFACCYKSKENFYPKYDMAIWTLLTNKRISLVLFAFASVFGVIAYLNVTLTVFMRQFSWTVLNVASLNFTLCASYIISTTICGKLLDIYPRWIRATLLVGLVGMGTTLIATIFDLTTLISYYLIFSGFGVFMALATIGSYSDNLKTAEDTFSQFDKSNIHSSLAGLWSTSTYITKCIYPVVGSLVDEAVKSIAMSYVCFGVLFYAMTPLISITFVLFKESPKQVPK